jgi:nucleotide-binding universal stress UspA family protein
MTKIISAIDFSDCSINAFLHALSIAQKCKSDLEMVWVGKPAAQKEKFIDAEEDASKEVKKKLEEMVAQYQPDLPDNKLTFKVRKGKVYKEIADEAKAQKALLVVAGTHGASGFEKFWIGSNANRIVSSCECPVITIRGGINIKRALHRIVMPIDSTMETRQKATFTAYLAKHHEAEVHVLRLYSSKVKAVRQDVDFYAGQVARYMEQEKIPVITATRDAENLSDAMIAYAQEVGANLISIMTDQESTTSNLWMGPYAQQTVNHSPIPVLSIHARELMTIQTS